MLYLNKLIVIRIKLKSVIHLLLTVTYLITITFNDKFRIILMIHRITYKKFDFYTKYLKDFCHEFF